MFDAIMTPWHGYVGFLEWTLRSIADLVHSGGLAIVIFTIIVKTILLPLTLKSIRSMKAMQDIQPKIRELQKKHGKNREELQKATMALYAQHQVNPVAGCLPMLIQIPIFFGVYHAIINLSDRNVSGYFGDSFLWLPSLGDPDPFYILPIAAGVFQFIQMRMSRPRVAPASSDPQQQIMNTVMNIMPVFVVIFGWTFASGAVLYWATQSIYSAVQQWFVSGWGQLKNYAEWLPEMPEHRRLGYVAPRNFDDVVVEYGPNGRPRAKGLMGKMQARLEEAQAQQEARREDLQAARAGGKPAAASTSRPAASTATRTRAGGQQRSPKKRANAQRATGAQARVDQVVEAETVKADATATEAEEVIEATPAGKPGKTSAGYASRVTGATRRGPKSSWGSASGTATPASGTANAGED
jgi:YidC/Oxa1 family membrane protein insertase